LSETLSLDCANSVCIKGIEGCRCTAHEQCEGEELRQLQAAAAGGVKAIEHNFQCGMVQLVACSTAAGTKQATAAMHVLTESCVSHMHLRCRLLDEAGAVRQLQTAVLMTAGCHYLTARNVDLNEGALGGVALTGQICVLLCAAVCCCVHLQLGAAPADGNWQLPAPVTCMLQCAGYLVIVEGVAVVLVKKLKAAAGNKGK
jgi:hypothetical protein